MNREVAPLKRILKYEIRELSGCSAVRLAHLLWEQRVASSNLATPTARIKRVLEDFQSPFFISGLNMVSNIFM